MLALSVNETGQVHEAMIALVMSGSGKQLTGLFWGNGEYRLHVVDRSFFTAVDSYGCRTDCLLLLTFWLEPFFFSAGFGSHRFAWDCGLYRIHRCKSV